MNLREQYDDRRRGGYEERCGEMERLSGARSVMSDE